MSDTWVMTETDKIEKKEAAEVRKRLKMEATQNNDRNLDLTNVPLSGYLQKRAQFKQEIRRNNALSDYQNQQHRTRSNSGECLLYVLSIVYVCTVTVPLTDSHEL